MKLSQLNVATFPWDPKPDPAPIVNPPTLPSNANTYQHGAPSINQAQGQGQAQVQAQGLNMPQVNNNPNGPRIKTEPGLENTLSMPQQPPQPYQNQILPPSATTAQQRAAQHLQNNYGQRAAASINAIQGGVQHPNGQQGGPTVQQLQHMQMMQQQRAAQGMPNQAQGQGQGPSQGMTQQQYQYRQQMLAQQERQRQQAQQGVNGHNGVGNAQTDGAGDEVESLGIIKRFCTNGEEIPMGRIEIDGLIRDKIESMGRSMEGGGLMLPLHKASTASQRKRKVSKSVAGVSQVDGPDEDDVKDEELDEDAINSDLDDPDDGLNEEDDDDEGMGHIMLCMYDKVQRVKNKWYIHLFIFRLSHSYHMLIIRTGSVS